MIEGYPDYCRADDAQLAKWTILRYLVLAAIVLYRVVLKMAHEDESSSLVVRFFNAGLGFVAHEGIGLVVYFAVSALMDNLFIFIVHSGEGGHYCGYVKMVALYSMALATFLPTCWVARRFQASMYDDGDLFWRFAFILIMVLVTVAFFCVRLVLVWELGFGELVKQYLTPLSFKVVLAILVPPLVDAIQSAVLISSSSMLPHDSVSVRKDSAVLDKTC
eukprot:TRINITY_DN16643_c0_g1_i1.p1 TRINITY_DN16643_c0_g1~~TRINITY_DN16643_c0_g1_i1.p1  ORF type:complete len:219 (-),score=33.01 TRINITY_DN16643_c0_g1_i1:168-824(-)